MKAVLHTILAANLLATAASGLAAQGVVTLSQNGPGTSNVVVVAEHDVAIFKTYFGPVDWNVVVRIEKDGSSLSFAPYALFVSGIAGSYSTGPYRLNRLTIAGPAKIIFISNRTASPALLTLEVQPQQFPPDKVATVGAFSGSVRVTMQDSTDLVNWTASANGSTYTNSPDAHFFRIKIDKLSGP